MKRSTDGSLACLAVALVLIPAAARAQTIPLPELPAYVEPGQIVTVTDAGGAKMTGRVETLTASAITLASQGGHRQAVPASTITRVVVQDSVKNGALIGLIAGAVPGVLLGAAVARYCTNEAASCPAAPLIVGALFAGAGAGIGAGIDGLIRRRLTIAPVLGSTRQGIHVSIRF